MQENEFIVKWGFYEGINSASAFEESYLQGELRNRKNKISQVTHSETLTFLQAAPYSISEKIKIERKTQCALTTCSDLERKEASSQQTWKRCG